MKFPSIAALALAAGGLVYSVSATIVVSKVTSCTDEYALVAPTELQMNLTDVLATLVNDRDAAAQNLPGQGVDVLRLDLLGNLNQRLVDFNNETEKYYTLFTSAFEAGVKQWESRSRLCTSVIPIGNTTYNPVHPLICKIPAGQFGMNISIPLYNIHELATLHTRIHVVDAEAPARTIACVNVYATPYAAGTWPYLVFLWVPAGIAMAYFVTTWAARFAAGWTVGANRASMGRREVTMLKWGTMVISGLSGERFGVSSALLRFVTPGLRDIMFHIQFVTMLGMIAINWPSFFYPIVSQSAWADLLWNVSIVSHEHQSLYPTNFTAPIGFDKQLNDPTHPLYMNITGEPRLLDLQTTPDGILSFAKAVGLRPQDLFGTCLALFLMLAAGIVAIHIFLWCVHCLTELASPGSDPRRSSKHGRHNASRSSLGGIASTNYGGHSRSSSNGKEWFDAKKSSSVDLDQLPATPTNPRAQRSSAPSKFHRIRKRFAFRGEAGAFHFAALYGNLLRLIVTFHFPITAFSVFQLTLSDSSIVARVFAALALAFISVLVPGFIMWKISRTPTGKLYDAARTLLALGTMYNVYEPGRQLYRTLPMMASLVQGVVIGAGQKSGLVQTVILVIVELCSFVATTVWTPWGEGAGMGAQVVFISILRIASIIMTMVMCREIDLEEGSQQWLTYAILILQAIIFVFFFFMILTKIVEGLIRLFGGAPFDESTHPIDGGIFAAIMDLDCFNGVRGGKAAERKRRKRNSRALQNNVAVAGSLNTQMMLDRHSQGVEQQGYPLLENRRGYHPVRNGSMDQFAQYSQRPASTDSISERLTDDSHGRILDNWRPPGESGPPLSPSEKSVHRQSWGGGPNARVHDSHHSRAQSSSAMEELMSYNGEYTSPYGPPPLSYPPTAENRNRGLRPAPLALAGHRSLNTIDAEDEEQRRTASGSRSWFARVPLNYDSDSEDDHAPADYGGSSSGGWRAVFSRRRKPMDERAKNEKMARKGAAINESGAALAGIAPPSGRFRVHRKQRTSSGDALAAARSSTPSTPLLAPPPASGGFKVHRGVPPGRRSSTPPSPQATLDIPLITENSSVSGPSSSVPSSSVPSSFRVQRKSPSGSPRSSTRNEPTEPLVDNSGYDAGMFQPLDDGKYGHAL